MLRAGLTSALMMGSTAADYAHGWPPQLAEVQARPWALSMPGAVCVTDTPPLDA